MDFNDIFQQIRRHNDTYFILDQLESVHQEVSAKCLSTSQSIDFVSNVNKLYQSNQEISKKCELINKTIIENSKKIIGNQKNHATYAPTARLKTVPRLYNGKKASLPSLTELCIKKIIANIEKLNDFSQLPSDLASKILLRLTTEHLIIVENNQLNHNITNLIDHAWKNHCLSVKNIDSLPEGVACWSHFYQELQAQKNINIAKIRQKIQLKNQRQQISKTIQIEANFVRKGSSSKLVPTRMATYAEGLTYSSSISTGKTPIGMKRCLTMLKALKRRQ